MPNLEPTYKLTARHIGVARRTFKEHEPRDLFSRPATELVEWHYGAKRPARANTACTGESGRPKIENLLSI